MEAQRSPFGSPEPQTPSSDSDTVLINPPQARRRDDEFYCRDVIFLVEEVLFKVPRRPFEQGSDAFHTIFSLPSSANPHEQEGLTDEKPILLEGVTEVEFRALLWVMFRPTYGPSRTLTKEQWEHVLKLATMWDFDTIRDKAISELGRLVRDPVSRLVLARAFSIPNWMEPALISLAQQETLAATELEHLGWTFAAKLIQVRESVIFRDMCVCKCNYCSVAHGQVHPHGTPPPPGSRPGQMSVATLRKQYDFSQKIRELFGTELY